MKVRITIELDCDEATYNDIRTAGRFAAIEADVACAVPVDRTGYTDSGAEYRVRISVVKP